MKKNIRFTSKKNTREMQVTVSFCFILAFVSLFLAYFITSWFYPTETLNEQNIPHIVADENVSVVDNEQTNAQETIDAEEEIYNLIKTYIYASVIEEKEILYSVSTLEWKNILNEKLSNNNQSSNKLKFLSNSLTLTKNTLSTTEGFYNVSYIIENGDENIQQNIQVDVVKENNVWKIAKIH